MFLFTDGASAKIFYIWGSIAICILFLIQRVFCRTSSTFLCGLNQEITSVLLVVHCFYRLYCICTLFCCWISSTWRFLRWVVLFHVPVVSNRFRVLTWFCEKLFICLLEISVETNNNAHLTASIKLMSFTRKPTYCEYKYVNTNNFSTRWSHMWAYSRRDPVLSFLWVYI